MIRRLKAAFRAFLEPSSIECKAIINGFNFHKSSDSAMISIDTLANVTKGDLISINGFRYRILDTTIEVAKFG
jgi:hypothetical protein